jgi:[ribosomal protein S5]-alanine N-acetyltransferase
MIGMTYRVAMASDAVELKRLNDAFNGQDSNTADRIREGLERQDAETVFVADQDGTLAGFCCAQLLRSICYSVFYVEITELYVSPEYQRQGIGASLVRYAEDWYRGMGIHDFQLFTGADNGNAQQFYTHIGYRRQTDVMFRKRDHEAAQVSVPPLSAPASNLLMKTLTEADYHNVYTVFSNEATMRYAYLHRFTSEEDFRPYFNRLVRETADAEGRWRAYTVWETDEIGGTGAFVGVADFELDRLAPDACNAEIGYFLLPDKWGKGYATQLAHRLLEICFRQQGVHKVTGSCNGENAASARVLRKCGMLHEGILRHSRYKDGIWYDEHKYGLTCEEYEARSAGRLA